LLRIDSFGIFGRNREERGVKSSEIALDEVGAAEGYTSLAVTTWMVIAINI
jgi:hypothetical protein